MRIDDLYPDQQRQVYRLIADIRTIYEKLPQTEGIEAPKIRWARELLITALAHKTEQLKTLGVDWQ